MPSITLRVTGCRRWEPHTAPLWSATASLLIKTELLPIRTFCANQAGSARQMILLGLGPEREVAARIYRTMPN